MLKLTQDIKYAKVRTKVTQKTFESTTFAP
jgi:hypothetical protein